MTKNYKKLKQIFADEPEELKRIEHQEMLDHVAKSTKEFKDDKLIKNSLTVVVEGAEIATIKGEKGDTPDEEDLTPLIQKLLPTEDDFKAIIEPLIPEPIKGDKGEEGLEGSIGPAGPQGKSIVGPIGLQGPEGKEGKQGPKGDKGEKGDTPEVKEIIKEISKLKGADRIPLTAIKDSEFLTKLGGKKFDMSDQRWHGGGLSTVSHDTTLTGDGTPANPLIVAGSASSYTPQGITQQTVGGIHSGDDLGTLPITLQTLMDTILYPELFPTLTAPSNSFSLTEAGNYEAGTIISTLHFSAGFNRGSINPQYTSASPYRSGLPNQYNYTGTGLAGISPVISTSLTDTETVSTYTVVLGSQSWTSSVGYDAGVQPKSSLGNNYSTPLPAGTTGSQTVSINGVFPYYYGVDALGLDPSVDGGGLTKVVAGNPFPWTHSYTTTANVPYIVYPVSYGKLKKVLDINGFDVSTDWGTQAGGPNTVITPFLANANITNSLGVTVACYVYQFQNITTTTMSYTFSQ